jgi:hypothetical protein
MGSFGVSALVEKIEVGRGDQGRGIEEFSFFTIFSHSKSPKIFLPVGRAYEDH